jgi:hypothetical protein
MTRLTDDEFDAELSKINDLVEQCLPILVAEIAGLYAVERGIDAGDHENVDKLLAELNDLDARTNGIPPIPETFSQEAKEALAKLWGEYTRLVIVDRRTRGPEIRKTLALIKEILAGIPPDVEAG